METVTLDNVEILRTGKWKGLPWTEKDIDKVIENFKNGIAKIGVKITKDGSHKGKPLVMPGGASLGWAEELRRTKDRLVAKFVNVPKKIGELIANGALSQKSVEGKKDFKTGDDKTHGRTLTGTLFFGAAGLPAVHGLSDLVTLYKLQDAPDMAIDYAYTEEDYEPETRNADPGDTRNGDNPKDPETRKGGNERVDPKKFELTQEQFESFLAMKQERKTLAADKEALETKVNELALKVESAEKSLTEKTAEWSELKEEKDRHVNDEIATFANKLVEEGKIKKAERDSVVEQLKLKDGDARVEYQKLLDNSPTIHGQKVPNPEPPKTDGDKSDTEVVHEKALAYQKEHPDVSYLEALDRS